MAVQNVRKAGEKDARSPQLASFVADLKELRKRAGQPSFRRMSQRSHYSHTALSGVLAGQRLPSLELTLGFVRACGGDAEAWRERWERESATMQAEERAPVESQAYHGRVLTRTFAALGAALLVVVLAAGAVLWLRGQPEVGTPAPAGAVLDGSDPQEQGCHVDAIHATTVAVGPPPYGNLTLRYSPRCQAAWPLFVSTEQVPAGAVIHLETRRPSDDTVTVFDYTYMEAGTVWSVFGNNLGTTTGCVTVTVEVRAPVDHRPLAAAATPCLTPGG